jgi:hypothetical protein
MRIARPEPAPAPEADEPGLHRAAAIGLAVVVIVGVVLPGLAFAATRAWSLSRSPASVSGGAAVVQVVATNTGSDGGGEAVGCILITIPNSAFTVSSVVIDQVSDGDAWSASYVVGATDTTVRIYSNSGGANRLHQDEWVAASISFTDTGLDGSFSWTGNAYNKQDCTDDFGQPHTVTVTIDGTATNTAPAAADDAYAAVEDTALTVGAPGVLGNDVDTDGDPLTAALTSGPSHAASFAFHPDGSFDYTADPDWSGTDAFTYQADDGAALSGPGTVTITVAAANDPPLGVDDAYATSEEVLLSVPAASGVLANDTDAENDPLVASLVSQAGSGLVTLAADGSFTYLPIVNFSGSDSFTYEVSDGAATTGPVTVSITIGSVNDPPSSTDDTYATAEDAVLTTNAASGVLANDSDPDGDPLTATLVSPPAHAASFTLRANGGFDYAPDPDWAGTDSFSYVADDGSASGAAATATIDVSAVNDPPLATGDAYVMVEDGTLSVPAGSGILANDQDAEGDVLTAVLVTGPVIGTLSLGADGAFGYVPPPNASGHVSFTYRAHDGTDPSSKATVDITITPQNDAPTARRDLGTTVVSESISIDVLGNDGDPDGDPLSITAVTQPAHGDVTVVGGRLRFSPSPDYIGDTSFTYTVSDGSLSSTATVTVSVAPEAESPSPSPVPSATPQPSASEPPAATPSPSSAPSATPASSPPTSPEPVGGGQPSPSATPDGGEPLAAPEVTITSPTSGDVGFGVGFGSVGGAFAWAVPAAMLGVPGLLFMLAAAGQLMGALAWVPAVRRSLRGIGVGGRRRKRTAER